MTTGSTGIGVSCPRCGAGAPPDARFCAGCGMGIADQALVAGAPRPLQPAVPLAPAVPPPPAAPGPELPPPGPPAPVIPGPPTMTVATPAASRGSDVLGVEPSAVGRRASPLGWVMVVLVACGFLAASIAVVAVASRPAGSGAGAGTGSGGGAPPARWDRVLYDGSTVADDTPFTIEVEAVNAAAEPTDPLWLVIDWTPDDISTTPGASGRVLAAEPDATVRADPAGDRTVATWPGLAPGGRTTIRVTVVVTGLEPGDTFWYRVRTGSGPDEPSLRGGYTWDLDLEVE